MLVRVQVERNRRERGNLSLDGIGLVMGRDAEGLVPVVGNLTLLGHGRSQHRGGQSGDGGERELHLDVGWRLATFRWLPEGWLNEDDTDIYVHWELHQI